MFNAIAKWREQRDYHRQTIEQFLSERTQRRQSNPRVQRLAPTPSSKVIRNGVRHVSPKNTPLVEERGWKRAGSVWVGSYATKFGTWQGRIQVRGDIFHVEIRNPPNQMRDHPKWMCVSRRKRGWYDVHLHDVPVDGDVSAIILYVEGMIAHSIKNY